MKRMLPPLAVIFFCMVFPVAQGYAQEAPPGKQTQPITEYEKILSNDMSIGIQGGYGDKVWDNGHFRLNTALLEPYFTLPVTNVIMKDWITRGVLEYKLEIPLGLITTLDDRGMAGLNPLGFRYDFTGLGGRLVPYASASLGMIYLDVPRQVQGTRYNFIVNAAIGTQYFIARRWTIGAECRFLHLSNGGIKEPNRGQNYLFGLVEIGRYF
ncbi:MAG: acyloxyacyl hydrolase [Nitrospirota bacterium]